MKVTIKNENKSSEIKFPCLMMSSEDVLVLFLCAGDGVVMKSGLYPIGHHSKSWLMDVFTPFTGTVELSND